VIKKTIKKTTTTFKGELLPTTVEDPTFRERGLLEQEALEEEAGVGGSTQLQRTD
jgi:hypothetical protein